MSNHRTTYTFIVIMSLIQPIHTSLDSVGKQISDAPKQVYDGGSSFIKGIAQSFGYCPDDYKYSFEVWNDTAQQLFIAAQKIVSVQGASFDSEVEATAEIPPYSTTSDSFYNKNICHLSVWLCTSKEQCKVGYKGRVSVSEEDLSKNTIFYRKIDVVEKDPTVYYFHIYSEQGVPKAEFLGPGLLAGPITTSNEFDGIFSNKTTLPAQLNFTKDNQKYTVTLEPQSWSLLSSTSGIANSIRPKENESRTFDFNIGAKTISIPIHSQGLAYSFQDQSTKQTTVVPATYSYAVYQDANNNRGIDIQGLSMGHADQPGVIFKEAKTALFGTTGSYNYPNVSQVRDINPVPCLAWYQSSKQFEQEISGSKDFPTNMIPYTPEEQCWISYVSKDIIVQQKIIPGTVATIHLLRPQLQEQTATLYVASFNATESAQKIALFFQRLGTGIIGKEATYTHINNPFTIPSDLLTTLTPNLHGVINDTSGQNASGIQGTILLIDTFTSRGMGEGPFYYRIRPSLLQLDEAFLATITAQLDPVLMASTDKRTAIENELKTTIPAWITTFAQQQTTIKSYAITPQNYKQPAVFSKIESIVPNLVSYLKQNGAPGLFLNPQAAGDARILNEQGKQALYAILFGPLSLANPPLLRQAGTNYAVLGGKPDNWPTASI